MLFKNKTKKTKIQLNEKNRFKREKENSTQRLRIGKSCWEDVALNELYNLMQCLAGQDPEHTHNIYTGEK